MRSSNPVFSRRGFSRGEGYAGFGGQPQTQGSPGTGGNPYAGTNPYAGGDAYDTTYQAPPSAPAQTGRMTMDDVVMRTAMTLGTVVLGALVAWFALPVSEKSYGLGIGAMLVALVLGLIQSFKREASPALILGYAVFEGVFLGVWSKIFNFMWPGIPLQAVLGTMAVFVGMLVAYRTRLIRVTARYTRIGMAIAIGFVILTFVNVIAAMIGGGDGLGLRSGALGVVVGIIGVALGAFFLSLDFKQIEDGIQYGAPRKESWLAAFGLTLSLVWIYLEMLRLISILRGDD
ncbi:Bax inhibitor-1/YccA family protein [Actinacidiphila glaucinigra]|uniref:Bax inhibitor-1/YccA family protein n=1 Tax=Actinacidiphila glaucinigra TaxID=235986 RepID=UPI002DDB0DDD|nr:Bax inhibitor-1/YccA family protein [Actinacidiphila glaucinigra]WSD61761.1 Bax inhibitor-1/YccA family protein [Actinacidiphila glaucinigra]